jgi:hypothetical protein
MLSGMSTVTAAPTEAPPPRPRAPRASLWTLRVVAVLVTTLVLLQPVLAGLYMSGSYDMLTGHEVNAHVLTLTTLIQFVAAVVFWARRGKGWTALLALLLMLVVNVQAGFGYARLLAGHVPMGVAITVVQVLFAVWLLGPRARVPRRSWRNRSERHEPARPVPAVTP